MTVKKGLMRDRLYIPVEYIDAVLYDKIQKYFTHEIEVFLPPGLCQECYNEYEGEPPCENDKRDCPHKTKKLFMYDRLRLDSGNYIALWRGNIPLLQKIFKGFKVKDRRSYPRVSKKLEFKGKLRKYQIEAVSGWIKGRSGGQIEAPARSGKTVIGTFLTCKLKYKTLILTHQIDLLEQFFDTFIKFTDFSEDEKNPRVVIARKGNIVEHVKNGAEVILSTYQTFISKKGKSRFKKVINSFGLVIVDECHLVSAECFSDIVTKLNPFLRLGLTATPDRKDGRDILAKYVLGEVVSRVAPPQLSGKAIMVHTGTNVGQWTNWSTMINRLAYNKRRNKLIIGYALKDLKAGHNLILVTERRKQCESLVEMLRSHGIKSEILYGNIKDRQKLIDKIRSGKVPVTVATRKIVRFGLNIPPWSAYYCLSPTNNPPNFYQEMSRIRTPYKGKKEPLVRYFVDSFSAAYSCARTCEKVLRQQKFTLSKESIDSNVAKMMTNQAKKKTDQAINSWNKFFDQ
jgi:superfamily II DNA or RNA helicase